MARSTRSKRRAQHIAKELLQRFGDDIPIDVEAIAAAHDIEVRREGLEDQVSGVLVIRDDRTIIGVNAHHHPNRQRFSLAHELGHFFLHRDEARFFIDAAPVFLRSDGAPPNTGGQEREANAFAAELLLPGRAVKEVWREDPIDVFDDVTIRRLADRFGVSAQALLIRLTELDLVFHPAQPRRHVRP